MRIWSLHPKYLDRQGLLACWRETLLAQKVLRGETHGYRNHPQLARFLSQPDPIDCIACYLVTLAEEAEKRGYHFDRSKIGSCPSEHTIPVTREQVLFEWRHLKEKLQLRDPDRLDQMKNIEHPEPHPLFKIIDGKVETWERTP
jgi:hypothetical protein